MRSLLCASAGRWRLGAGRPGRALSSRQVNGKEVLMSVTRASLGQQGRTRKQALPAAAGEGPVAARIRLGARLRGLREEAGISREAAAGAIGASAPKISRVELGRTAVKARDLVGLLTLYGASDQAERESM